MKKAAISFRLTILMVVSVLLVSGCTSMTKIETIPPGAKIYINDELSGETPYTLADTKIIGSTSSIRFEKSGYKTFQTYIKRDEQIDAGPVVCGFIFTPVWWLWALKYKPVHLYELVPGEQ